MQVCCSNSMLQTYYRYAGEVVLVLSMEAWPGSVIEVDLASKSEANGRGRHGTVHLNLANLSYHLGRDVQVQNTRGRLSTTRVDNPLVQRSKSLWPIQNEQPLNLFEKLLDLVVLERHACNFSNC